MSDFKIDVLNILKGKCPSCREGSIYVQKRIFPLNKMLSTVENCPVCGQKIKSKHDNAPGINYALSVIVYAIAVILYAAIWGITYKDNSFIYAFLFSTVVVVLLQPWLMRLSKAIHIYVLIKFK